MPGSYILSSVPLGITALPRAIGLRRHPVLGKPAWKCHELAGGRRLTVRAGPEESSQESSWLEVAQGITSTPFYRVYLQGGVLLGLLALIDAAYSGDWSRIGVISKADEVFLQQILWIVLGVHIASALGVAKLKVNRGQDWLLPTGKALAVGFLAFIEVVFDKAPPKSSV